MTGAKLRERRQSLGLTQQRLADRLEVSRNTVARWERGEMAIPGFLDLALRTVEREKPRKRKAGTGFGEKKKDGK